MKKNILIVMINNKSAIHDGTDCDIRYEIFSRIAFLYSQRGHNVNITPCDNGTNIEQKMYEHFNEYNSNISYDLLICWSPVLNTFLKKTNINCPYISYENGHLRGSIIIDPIGLLDKSLYVSTLNSLCELNYDSIECDKYINMCTKYNYSKRSQPEQSMQDLPININGKFVFIPTQYHNDISLINSKIKMMDCVYNAMILCRRRNIPLVIKIHPHLKGKNYKFQENILNKLKCDYNLLFISKMSINTLMKNALFTITLNGSSIMDNFINQTPVLVLLPCLYSNTDAVIYDNDLEKGFERMLNKDYNLEHMLEKQRKIIYWYINNNLFIDNSEHENVKIINKHIYLEMKHHFRYPTIIKYGNKYNIYISIGGKHSGEVIDIYKVDLPITRYKCLTNFTSIIKNDLVAHNFTVFKGKCNKKYYGIGGMIRNQRPFNDFNKNNGIYLYTFLNNRWIKINNNKPIISINNLPDNAIISIEEKAPEFDSNIVCFYSNILKKYLLFCRANIATNHRSTQVITSPNLIEWSSFKLLKINNFTQGQNHYMFKCIEFSELNIFFALTPFTHLQQQKHYIKKLISFDSIKWFDIGILCDGELAYDKQHINIHIGEIFYENKILEIILLNKVYSDNPEFQLYKFNYNDFIVKTDNLYDKTEPLGQENNVNQIHFIDFLKSVSIKSTLG